MTDAITHDSNVVKKGRNDEDRTSGDCISRQATINKIKKRLFETAFNNVGIKQNIDETLVDVAENRLENWFNELPSIQPEQRWIPVSERLPAVGKGVLLTTTFPTLVIGWLKSDGKWLIYENDGNSFQDYITAWMPLPEPYQAERRENDGYRNTEKRSNM